jgi:hypothetical protein
MNPFPSLNLPDSATAAMAQGLYALAAVDGVHPRELRLIESFHSGVATGKLAGITPEALAAALPDRDARIAFVKTALMVAHVHGSVTDAERDLLHAYARALDVSEVELLSLEYELLSAFEQAVNAQRSA